jgi:hypothetical protein
MAKRGPPLKFTAAIKAKVIQGLERGMSLADMLTLVGFCHRSFRNACAADPEFSQGVKSAAGRGKLHHLERVHEGNERWQSSAWFLERKYGAEYGQKLQVQHGGRVEVAEVVIHTRQEAQEALSSLGKASRLSGHNGQN